MIGRQQERTILLNALKSDRSELLVVYGRRRIGKTYLVRQVYGKDIILEFSGMYKASFKDQLLKFHLILSKHMPKAERPKNWIEAFHILELYLDRLKSKKKKVLFFDEFPWFDTRRSGFLAAFDNFWNGYITKRNDFVVVVCGSAASYMVKKIIGNKGGLHNRLTEKIQLLPFNLFETQELLRANGVKLTPYDILQLYMAMGGVPHYLEKVLPGESVARALDRLCFEKNGFLRTEFTNVFASLFDQYENHEAIIRALAGTRKGLTRNDILKKSKISSGGTLTKTLNELEQSGFLENYVPYQGIKDSIYRLTDEYSMFYIKYIEGTRPSAKGYWMKMQGKQSYKIWAGFSFETICMKHVEQIKEGLRIGGINSVHGSWIEKNTERGAQIDLLIDRDDNVVNLCEMKFYNAPFTIDKKYAIDLANKVDAFARGTNTRKSIFVTFITTYGLEENQYSRQHVQNELNMEHLFVDL